ncbi:hypothetical protein [Methanobacterium sp. SMA-27]|uniref:hypothetical protein n=1 Tax=Methanobacterium sp. SMA-27 TaxID=1495336 RepID=UPI000A6A9343|nr:hypothetical protein [Methanobacterium sp. SMA-27]
MCGGGNHKNGIINGGLSAGIVGFIYTLMIIVFTSGSTITAAVNNALLPQLSMVILGLL